jgi:hypothetical protein
MTYDDLVQNVRESFDKACDSIEKHYKACETCKKEHICDESRKMYTIHGDIELLYYKYVETDV